MEGACLLRMYHRQRECVNTELSSAVATETEGILQAPGSGYHGGERD